MYKEIISIGANHILSNFSQIGTKINNFGMCGLVRVYVCIYILIKINLDKSRIPMSFGLVELELSLRL